MAEVVLNIPIDEDLKEGCEKTCKNMGLTVPTAVRIFLTKMNREKRIPFKVEDNPLFPEED